MLAHLIAQTSNSTTTTSFHLNGTAVAIGMVVGVGLAAIPAVIATRKGYSFIGFFFFGLFCWLPALIVSLMIADRTRLPFSPIGGYHGQGTYQAPTPHGVAAASGPPPGWYPDPGGSPQQRYWDGARWTEHLT